jgi:hypothetical protein
MRHGRATDPAGAALAVVRFATGSGDRASAVGGGPTEGPPEASDGWTAGVAAVGGDEALPAAVSWAGPAAQPAARLANEVTAITENPRIRTTSIITSPMPIRAGWKIADHR